MKLCIRHLELIYNVFLCIFIENRMEKSVDADKESLDISLCIICESMKPEELVKKPTKHEKVLSSLEE